jgi:hypothetical protein
LFVAAHETAFGDLRAAPTNVRSWESNGPNADVAFGPFMTRMRHQRAIFAVMHSDVLA